MGNSDSKNPPTFLGHGAFGRVFHDKERNVAIKKIASYNADAEKEVAIMKQVQHDYIIKLLESYYEDSTLCIVLEYADKGTLKTYIEAQPKQRKEYKVWRLMGHLSSALKYLHSAGILHRDIKPDNVLGVTGWNSEENKNAIAWKLADFGIAKLLTDKDAAQFYNTASIVNQAIIAPEVLQSWSKFSEKADIWALGLLMLFVCNHGNYVDIGVLFRGELSARNIQGSYSSDLVRILQRMVNTSPHSRPSAGEISRECTEDRQEWGLH